MATPDDQKIAEETAEFHGLSEADQMWICFCMDVSEFFPPHNEGEWASRLGSVTVLSASDVLYSGRTHFHRAFAAERNYRFSANVYPDLIRAGAFVTQHGVCRAFRSFNFLFERMFGGLCRPLIPSVYLAIAGHPDLDAIQNTDELMAAVRTREEGWGTFECLFRPDWKFH